MGKVKEEPKKGRGRPAKEINWVRVEELASYHATGKEIAADQNIHYSNLVLKWEKEYAEEIELGFYTNFTEFMDYKKEKGKTIVREQQFLLAKSGDRAMNIFLGKNLLDQRDRPDTSKEDSDFFFESLDNDLSPLEESGVDSLEDWEENELAI